MKQHYLSILPLTCMLLITGSCSKDFLKRYEKRVTGGTWHLDDVHSTGTGSGYNLPFTTGYFTFYDGGQLDYTDASGSLYTGTWDIGRDYSAYNDTEVNTLQISVVNFQTQDLLSEYFDEMVFTGTDRFVTRIYFRDRTYKFVFKR